MVQPIVTITNLNHFYGTGEMRRQIIFDINLAIQPGEFVIMTGPSGSGKSTLLSLIGCLRSVQQGSLQLLGQELNGASKISQTQVRRWFGYITQASNLVRFLTTRQNIAMAIELGQHYPRPEIHKRTEQILESVGLLPQIDHYPHQLSGGQKQRVAIACALVSEPKLVLADEPTAALDGATGRKTVELIHRLAKERSSAVLMVTHDPRILDIADRILHMRDGHLELAYSQELSLALPGLREDQIMAMAVKPNLLTYEPGTYVFREGDPARQFYVVVEGCMEVVQERSGNSPKVLNQLGRGDYFGEIGLIQKQGRRTASVRVTLTKEAKLIVVDRADFRKLMAGSNLTSTVIAEQLQKRVNTSILSEALPSLNRTEISQILPQVERFKYGPGSHIFNIGDPSRYFYIVVSGRVEILCTHGTGEETVLNTHGPGSYFGEIGLLEDQPRRGTARAHARTPVEVLALPRSTFLELMEASPLSYEELAQNVYETVKQIIVGQSALGQPADQYGNLKESTIGGRTQPPIKTRSGDLSSPP